MGNENFFEESTEQSTVKARIVEKYFWAWSKVIIPRAKFRSGKLAYIDFFAGPGRYKDGKKSTPLLILEAAIRDDNLSNMLVTLFNDIDKENSDSLRISISELPGVERLNHKPEVNNDEVGKDFAGIFERMRTIPTLFFIDPWGYKGLSLRLINAVIKNWGCDCIFFFNYNRINMGLNNPHVKEHMNALFGEARADNLRSRLINMNPYEREMTIVEEMSEALKEKGGNFVLPFSFKNDLGNRTSHHLFFVSKNFTGYEIMKEIMAKESSESDQGVPSFQYNIASKRWPVLFELSRPLDDLEKMLQEELAGKTLTMKQIYLENSIGKPYIKKNYKDILIKMEAAGKISADPPANERRVINGKVTFGDDTRVIFPVRRE